MYKLFKKHGEKYIIFNPSFEKEINSITFHDIYILNNYVKCFPTEKYVGHWPPFGDRDITSNST